MMQKYVLSFKSNKKLQTQATCCSIVDGDLYQMIVYGIRMYTMSLLRISEIRQATIPIAHPNAVGEDHSSLVAD